MARGTPDGRITDNQFAAQVSDVAHVNNMLWGFSPIDGQGRVIYFDTFNNGLMGWRLTATGGGSIPFISSPASHVFSPPNIVNLNPGITANDTSNMIREMFAGKSTRLGLEVGYRFNSGCQIFTSLDYNPISGLPYFGRLMFSQSIGAWRVTGTSGSITFYTPGAPPAGLNMLIQTKIVMDFSTGKYVRAFIGDQDFDISTISMASSSSSYNGFMTTLISHFSQGAAALNCQMGYVLITKDEP